MGYYFIHIKMAMIKKNTKKIVSQKKTHKKVKPKRRNLKITENKY